MRVLGIDIGLKRTGLALSDELGISVRMLPNLVVPSRAKAIESLVAIVVEYNVGTIVIGRPEPRTKASLAIANRADGLKEALDEVLKTRGLGVKTYVWDEALSSKMASFMLANAGIPKKKRASLLDAASAAILVEEFLKSVSES